jgi:apolipoprotein N-acyltransferase
MIPALAAAARNIKSAAARMYKFLKAGLCAVLSAVFLAASFPKIDLFFLAWIAFIGLIFVIEKSSAKSSFFYGLVCGFCFYAITIEWLFGMLKFNTGSSLQAIISCIILWTYLALYFAVWAYLVNKLYRRFPKIQLAVLAACLWVLLEFIRTYLFTGFPWILLGYSQYKFLPLIQIVEFTGVYGVSFLIIFVNFLIYFFFTDSFKKGYLLVLLALIFAVSIFGLFRMNKFNKIEGESFNVAIAQPSVDQYKKWDRKYRREILDDLQTFADEISQNKVDLVLWPETAMPNILTYGHGLGFMEQIMSRAGGFNIFGSLYEDENGDLYNTLIGFDDDKELFMHKKNHLVPFGEYVPFRKFLSRFFGVLNTLGDINKGNQMDVFFDEGLAIGPLICSENFFPNFSRRLVNSGALVLTNHTNDAWFFDTAAPYQHFIMNVFRAVENRRMVLISANSGISGKVDAVGKILYKTVPFEKDLFFTRGLQIKYKTFYTKFGDVFVLVCLVLFIILLSSRAFLLRGNQANGKMK